MKRLSNNELKRLKGGFSAWVGLGIAGAIVFLAGIIDGFTRPLTCNK